MTGATANVNALLPWPEQRAHALVEAACMLSKVHRLEQFGAAGLEVVHYFQTLAAAARPDGSRGVQLWIRMGLHVITWEALSRYLVYAVVAKHGVQFGALSGHAPHTMASAAVRDAWWEDLSELFAQPRSSHRVPWPLLLDANARASSPSSTAWS